MIAITVLLPPNSKETYYLNSGANDFGGPLVWEPLENKRACRIKSEAPGNVFDKDHWGEMIEFMTDSMVALEKAFKSPIKKVGMKLKHNA